MPNLKIRLRDGIYHVSGTIRGQRIRESLGTSDRLIADELRAQLEARIWKRQIYGEEAVRTFEEAALSYMGQGGDKTYLPKLLQHFRGRRVGSITAGEIRDAAIKLYPQVTGSTRNRACVVPARAVINHAHSMGWCPPVRVKLFDSPKSRKHKPVSREWLDRFMAQADQDGLPHLSGIVLFMHQTGARVAEAMRLTGEHVDLEKKTAVLERTKTDPWSVRHLTVELVKRMSALGLEDGKRVFRYTSSGSVTRRMKAVCRRAGLDPRSTHSAGRHSFATNAIGAGAHAKAVMEAGGWKSARLFLETYVHAEDGGRQVAALFDASMVPPDTNLASPNDEASDDPDKKG